MFFSSDNHGSDDELFNVLLLKMMCHERMKWITFLLQFTRFFCIKCGEAKGNTGWKRNNDFKASLLSTENFKIKKFPVGCFTTSLTLPDNHFDTD